MPLDVLAADNWMGAEQAVEAIRTELVALPWQSLSAGVGRGAARASRCRISLFIRPQPHRLRMLRLAFRCQCPIWPALRRGCLEVAAAYPLSLAGKTVLLERGPRLVLDRVIVANPECLSIRDHRGPQQRRGRDAVPHPLSRERGRHCGLCPERGLEHGTAIADNAGLPTFTATGLWDLGPVDPATAGGSYLYALTDGSGALTAQATWSLSVPAQRRYAVCVGVPGPKSCARCPLHGATQGGATEAIIDQSVHPRTWRYLGTFPSTRCCVGDVE